MVESNMPLKPCPFCGGKASVRNENEDERTGYRETWQIKCIQCGATAPGSSYMPYGEWVGGGKPNIEQDRYVQMLIAYDNWNTRPRPANRFYGEQRVEIKTGIYGIVNISRGPYKCDDKIWVGVTSDVYTSEELRNAAHIFNQLAEALERE